MRLIVKSNNLHLVRVEVVEKDGRGQQRGLEMCLSLWWKYIGLNLSPDPSVPSLKRKRLGWGRLGEEEIRGRATPALTSPQNLQPTISPLNVSCLCDTIWHLILYGLILLHKHFRVLFLSPHWFLQLSGLVFDIHSFVPQLLSACYLAGTVPRTGDTELN